MNALIDAALTGLSQDETQQSQVANSITAFFHSVYQAVLDHDPAPIYDVLDAWVAARSAPTEGELTRLLPVIVKLKQIQAELIAQRSTTDEAVKLLSAMEKVYDPAIIYLSNLEADAVLAHMRQQLQVAQVELDRLDKSKSDFIEVAAHELRTPITLVEGYSNMLRTSIPNIEEDPLVLPLLDGIGNGVTRLREIIRDMLDVSIISLGMIELSMQSAWLTHLMQALERNIREYLVERNVEFVIEYETIPKDATYGDPERLLQVFQKIVLNAIKYTPDGGQVRVTARRLTSFTDIMVIDNGIGIDPENLTRIFSMFSTIGDSSLHSSGKAKFRGGGPGLGLFISKGIIEAHGGNIWAESQGYDEVACYGSTFHIMIPMRGAPADDKIGRMLENRD
jgi:signal transduction histidine kinase